MGKNVSYPLKGDIVHNKKWIYLGWRTYFG
jgi:hypothetical protein